MSVPSQKWQMELLMERLRNKGSQQKSFAELSKCTRMALLEKRYALDAVEKANLQKCLDNMQHCIKVTSKQGLVERLESLSRQLGLKYMEEENSSLFISSDMFYLEILLHPAGSVHDVKVHHECKSLQSCPELVECLTKGDFVDFTTQLENFASIYQLNAEPKIKSKAFLALQAVEQDVLSMYQLNSYFTDVQSLIMESPTGLVQARRGGHPMRLTYFLAPAELLDLQAQRMQTASAELVLAEGLGRSVTINLVASVAHKLQIQPTLNVTDAQNFSYDPITPYNSTMLPASFVLTLSQPMPISAVLLDIARPPDQVSGGRKAEPIMGLIAEGARAGAPRAPNLQKGLVVSLPDQCHCYFMTDNREMAGEAVAAIPFTEPSQLFRVVQLLRQQALFNTLIASCVRPNARPDMLDSVAMTIFEVSALSTQHIHVALEHPHEDSMITVEFDLTSVAAVQCKITPSSPVNEQVSTRLSKVAQASLSIPMVMRALVRAFAETEQLAPHKPVPGHGSNLGGDAGAGVGAPAQRPDPGMGTGGAANASAAAVESKAMGGGGGAGSGGQFGSAYNVFDPGAAVSQSLPPPVSVASAPEEVPIKKRRLTGEDFRSSPGRNNVATEQHSASGATENSTSLGGDNSGVLGTSLDQGSGPGARARSNVDDAWGTRSDGEDAELGNSLDEGRGDKARHQHVSAKANGGEGAVSPAAERKKAPQNSIEAQLARMGTPYVSITPIPTHHASTVSPAPSSSIHPTSPQQALPQQQEPSLSSADKRPSLQSVLSDMGIATHKRLAIEIIPLSPSVVAAVCGPQPPRNPSKTAGASVTITPIDVDSRGKGVKKASGDEHERSRTKRRRLDECAEKARKSHSGGSGGGSRVSSGSPKNGSIVQGSGRGSPKGGSRSPSASGSGKPNMTTLKSATVTGSPKGDRSPAPAPLKSSSSNVSVGSRERDRDRDKRSAGGSPKVKPSSVKLKPIDLNAGCGEGEQSQDGVRSGSGSLKGCSNSGGGAAKAKSSLSAVIDKLKSAQGPEGEPSVSADDKQLSRDGRVSSSGYIIKPSSDGMKLTINKTKHRGELGKSSSSALPRSQSSSSLRVCSSGKKFGLSSASSAGSRSKPPFQKSSSSGSLTSPSSGPKAALSTSRVVPGESQKISSDKKHNAFSTSSEGVGKTPTDVLKLLGLPSANSMDGFMKCLDKKFQIPKLSARATDADGSKRAASVSSLTFLSPTTTVEPATDANPPNTGNAVSASHVEPAGLARVYEKGTPESGRLRPALQSATETDGRLNTALGSGLCVPVTSVLHPPSSSSVSLHIVKSPVPASVHLKSPCITDDELMDEALVSISGK